MTRIAVLAAAVLLSGLTSVGAADLKTISVALPCLPSGSQSPSPACLEVVQAVHAIAGDDAKVAYAPSIATLVVSADEAIVSRVQEYVKVASAKLRRGYSIVVSGPDFGPIAMASSTGVPAVFRAEGNDRLMAVEVTTIPADGEDDRQFLTRISLSTARLDGEGRRTETFRDVSVKGRLGEPVEVGGKTDTAITVTVSEI